MDGPAISSASSVTLPPAGVTGPATGASRGPTTPPSAGVDSPATDSVSAIDPQPEALPEAARPAATAPAPLPPPAVPPAGLREAAAGSMVSSGPATLPPPAVPCGWSPRRLGRGSSHWTVSGSRPRRIRYHRDHASHDSAFRGPADGRSWRARWSGQLCDPASRGSAAWESLADPPQPVVLRPRRRSSARRSSQHLGRRNRHPTRRVPRRTGHRNRHPTPAAPGEIPQEADTPQTPPSAGSPLEVADGGTNHARLQPTPAAEATALLPKRGVDKEREWLRKSLGAEYGLMSNAAARILSEHPGFQGALAASAG